jgi:hypothetical protein
MNEPAKGYRYSSARRPGRRPSPVALAAAVIAVLAALIAFISPGRPPEIAELPPTPTSPPFATAPPSPTATATRVVELISDWVTVSSPENTPTPWPTIPEPTRRQPKPTPRLSECVSYRWTTVQVFRPTVHVLTEIRALNNCNRDIEPSNLMFEVSGWRNGDFIQSVRGMPFDRIRRRRSEIIAIGLPGSLDWYDVITVEIID